MIVNWTAPAGTWDTLRLVRNRYGWAVNEHDGEVLLNIGHSSNYFADTGVVGGHWLYYTIFLSVSGVWYRAGMTSTLMPKNNGYTDLLYDLVPQYYKVVVTPGNNRTDDSNTINTDLLPFLSTFGFGLDLVKTYYDSNQYTNDAMRMPYDNIQEAAGQFGIQFEASTPAYLFRQRVRDAATLGRQKGTLEQIRSVISETTGWDTDIRIGRNLMLNNDQSNFDNPTYPQWDSAVNYAAGERAVFGSFLYQAAVGGAYGTAQKPSGTATSNTWWTTIAYGTDTTLVNANGNVAGWEEISFTAGVSPGTGAVLGGIGVQNPTDPTYQAGNALWVRNTNSGGVTATMGARSVAKLIGQSTMDPTQPVLWGIPVPQAYQEWSGLTYYVPGDLVLHHGRTYQALTASLNVSPPDAATANAQWQPLAYDNRVQLCLSGYTEGHSGQQVTVSPFMEFYDIHGALITSLFSDAVPAYSVMDTFTQNWADWSGRITDTGAITWTEAVGQWTANGYDDGVAYPTNTGRAIATLAGHADGTVSGTFATSPSAATHQGLLFRYQDSSNYFRAGRTALYLVTAGVVASTFNYSTPCVDGDRLTVAYSGSSIAVQRNGVQVLSITNSTLLTATVVGMVVEA